MITYLTHEKIDKVRWDDCVKRSSNGVVYALSWYLDVVHPGWEALVEIDDVNYLYIMPLTCKKRYFINYLCQPFFVQQLGIFSAAPVTSGVVKSFLSSIPQKYRLVEIRLNEQNPVDNSWKGVGLHRNHLLDLNNEYNLLYSNYHENTKRNLKKSLNYNLQLVEEVPIQKVISLFRNDRGTQVKHWGDAEYAVLERLTVSAISLSNALIYGVKSFENDDIICGALFVLHQGRITFLFSGNSPFGKECRAMTFLLDAVIRKFAGRPLVLDFEGSDDDNLARFYHGFGSEQVTYPSFAFRLKNPFS